MAAATRSLGAHCNGRVTKEASGPLREKARDMLKLIRECKRLLEKCKHEGGSE